MKIIGIILLVVGAIIFYGTKLMYKRNKKKMDYNPNKNDNEEFLALLNNGAIVTKIIGALLVVSGVIIILLFY
ncbi:hypothetical protein SH1V18_04800 [Vallitalea longa]|uniref:Uncharacterized protein n=1 Tax=Vallitalea longa TaxID=2936439 RepID=A0A9W5Y7B1_9FIRM|nr:hypothetical protein [Vallitalea longa]GKX28000.1 hypothetical protein SH1V18_04800 [Vallitalea longa]